MLIARHTSHSLVSFGCLVEIVRLDNGNGQYNLLTLKNYAYWNSNATESGILREMKLCVCTFDGFVFVHRHTVTHTHTQSIESHVNFYC